MAKALRERGFVPRRSLWEVDHIVPLIDGGSHAIENLQTLCTPCHKQKTAAEATARAARPREAGTSAPDETLGVDAEATVEDAAEPVSAEASAQADPKSESADPTPTRHAKRGRRRREQPLGELLSDAAALNERVESALRELRPRS